MGVWGYGGALKSKRGAPSRGRGERLTVREQSYVLTYLLTHLLTYRTRAIFLPSNAATLPAAHEPS